MIDVYTTAPEVYDGFSTTTVDSQVGTDHQGYTVRLVQMESRDYDWQTGRYRSGLYAAYGKTEAEDMFGAGLWKRAERT